MDNLPPLRCRVPISRRLGSGTCDRLLTDLCRICQIYEKDKHEWAAIYGIPDSKPRVAVDGDI